MFELLLRHGVAEGISRQRAVSLVRCEVGCAVLGTHQALVGRSCAVVGRGLSVVAGLLQLVLALIDGKLDVALLEHLLLEVFFSVLAVALDALGCSPLDVVVALVQTSLIARSLLLELKSLIFASLLVLSRLWIAVSALDLVHRWVCILIEILS